MRCFSFYYVRFRLKRLNSEIGCQLVLMITRKSHTGFRLIPTSMTLNDLERRNSPYFAFFLPNSIALLAITPQWLKIPGRPIMFAEYCLPVPVQDYSGSALWLGIGLACSLRESSGSRREFPRGTSRVKYLTSSLRGRRDCVTEELRSVALRCLHFRPAMFRCLFTVQ